MPRSLTIPLGAGSEPEMIEIDDAHEAAGELETDDFGDVIDLCPQSPCDHHVYSMKDNFERCIYCGRRENVI